MRDRRTDGSVTNIECKDVESGNGGGWGGGWRLVKKTAEAAAIKQRIGITPSCVSLQAQPHIRQNEVASGTGESCVLESTTAVCLIFGYR